MRKSYVIGLAVVIGVVAVWLWRGRAGDKSGENPSKVIKPAPTDRVRPELATPSSRPDLSAEAKRIRSEKLKSYPPSSRPLSAGHKLDPNRPSPVTRRLGDSDHSYILTADRHAVVGDGRVTFSLQAFPTKSPDQRVAIDVRSSAVKGFKTAVDQPGVVANPSFTDADGDLIYTATLVPAEAKLAAGTYVCEVEIATAGVAVTGRQHFSYTPDEAVPARFTGRLEDRLEDGSLVIRVEVDVSVAGKFAMSASLFSAAGEPVARSRFDGELATGTQMVEMLFYGKVLRDQGKAGPYIVRGLRGHRSAADRRPSREDMAPLEGEYRTQDYPVDGFTAKAWSGSGKGRGKAGSWR